MALNSDLLNLAAQQMQARNAAYDQIIAQQQAATPRPEKLPNPIIQQAMQDYSMGVFSPGGSYGVGAMPQQEATWSQKLGSTIDQMQGSLWGAAKLGADVLGLDSAALQQQVDLNAAEAEASLKGNWFSPEQHWEEGNYGSWLRDNLLQQVPQLAAPIAGGLFGGPVGAMAGMGLSAGAQMAGQLYNEGSSAEAAALGGVGSAAANALFGLGPVIGGVMGKAASTAATKKAKEQLAKAAGRGFLKQAGISTGKAAGGEAISEGLDSYIEQAAKNVREGKSAMPQDMSLQQWKDIGYGAFTGATIGGLLGGAPQFITDRREQAAVVAGNELAAEAEAAKETQRVNRNVEYAQQQAADSAATNRLFDEKTGQAINQFEQDSPGTPSPLYGGEYSMALDAPKGRGRKGAEWNPRADLSAINDVLEEINRNRNISIEGREGRSAAIQREAERQIKLQEANEKLQANRQQRAFSLEDIRAKRAERIREATARLQQQQQQQLIEARKQVLEQEGTYQLTKEKIQQARTKTRRDNLRLAQELQNMQEARAARQAGPKLSAKEQAKQDEIARANYVAGSVLQNAESILNPQAAQQRQAFQGLDAQRGMQQLQQALGNQRAMLPTQQDTANNLLMSALRSNEPRPQAPAPQAPQLQPQAQQGLADIAAALRRTTQQNMQTAGKARLTNQEVETNLRTALSGLPEGVKADAQPIKLTGLAVQKNPTKAIQALREKAQHNRYLSERKRNINTKRAHLAAAEAFDEAANQLETKRMEGENRPNFTQTNPRVQHLDQLDALGLSPNDYVIVASGAAVQQGGTGANADIDIIVRPNLIQDVTARASGTNVSVAPASTDVGQWGTTFEQALANSELVDGRRFLTRKGVGEFYNRLYRLSGRDKHAIRAREFNSFTGTPNNPYEDPIQTHRREAAERYGSNADPMGLDRVGFGARPDWRTPTNARSVYGGERGAYRAASDGSSMAANLTAGLERAEEEGVRNKNLSDSHKERIFRETGWFRGPEGKLKFVLPDHLDKVFLNNVTLNDSNEGVATLAEVYAHPKLYEIYPELRDVNVVISSDAYTSNRTPSTIASYDPNTNTITLNYKNTKSLQRKVPGGILEASLIHEIQHAVQEIEGFAKGGNPSQFVDVVNRVKTARLVLEQLSPAARNTLTRLARVAQRDVLPHLRSLNRTYGLSEDSIKAAYTAARTLISTPLANFIDDDTTPTSLYMRLAGEAEAREVAIRAEFPEFQDAMPNYWADGDLIISDDFRYTGMSQADIAAYEAIPLDPNSTPDASVAQAPIVQQQRAKGRTVTVTREAMSEEAEVTATPIEQASRPEKALAEADKDLLSIERIKTEFDASNPDSLRAKAPNFWSVFLENMVDSLRPVYEMVKSVHQDGLIKYYSNIYKQMEALPNVSAAALKHYHDAYVTPVKKALADYAKAYVHGKVPPKAVNKVAIAEATEYLEHLHAYERNEFYRNKGQTTEQAEHMSGITYAKIEEIRKKYADRDMLPILKAMQDLNEAKLTILEKNNLISKDSIANYRAAYSSWMPLAVDWDSMMQVTNPAWFNSDLRRSVSANAEKFKKKVSGRDLEKVNRDPLSLAIQHMYDAVMLNEKVVVQRGILAMVADNPDSVHFSMVRSGKDATARALSWDSKDAQLKWKKLSSDVEINGRGQAVNPDNTVVCIDRDGVLQKVEFADNRVARALRGENVTQLNTFMQSVRRVGRMLMQLVTAKSPLFWSVNPMRDAQTAIVNSLSLTSDLSSVADLKSMQIAKALIEKGIEDAFSLVTPGTKGVRSALYHFYRTGDASFTNVKGMDEETKKYMGLLPSFIQYGGQNQYFSDSSFKAISKDIESAVNDLNPETRMQKVKQMLRNADNWMDAVSDSLENKTRYIVFKETFDAMERTTSRGNGVFIDKNGNQLTREELMMRAANAAMNITVNFSKKGALAPIMDTLYWFAGANIAGNVRMLETILRKGTDGKVSWANITGLVGIPLAGRITLAMVCRELMGDDDDGVNHYDKIPQYVKDANIILPSPFGGKDYIKIPVAYGYNIFWNIGGIGEAVQAKADGRPARSIQDSVFSAFTSAFDNFNVAGKSNEGLGMLIPSTIRPFYQWHENKGWTGSPIMPEGTNAFTGANIPASERYWRSMSKPVIELCKYFNEATGGSSERAGWLDMSPETLEHFASSYTGGIGRILMTGTARIAELAQGKTPEYSRFATPFHTFGGTVRESDSNIIFNEARKRIQLAVNETKLANNDRGLTPERREELIERNADAYRLKDKLNLIQSQLNNIRSQERRGNLGQASLDKLQERRVNLQKQLIKASVNAGIPVFE